MRSTVCCLTHGLNSSCSTSALPQRIHSTTAAVQREQCTKIAEARFRSPRSSGASVAQRRCGGSPREVTEEQSRAEQSRAEQRRGEEKRATRRFDGAASTNRELEGDDTESAADVNTRRQLPRSNSTNEHRSQTALRISRLHLRLPPASAAIRPTLFGACGRPSAVWRVGSTPAAPHHRSVSKEAAAAHSILLCQLIERQICHGDLTLTAALILGCAAAARHTTTCGAVASSTWRREGG